IHLGIIMGRQGQPASRMLAATQSHYMAELEQDPFDGNEFVERIAWRASADRPDSHTFDAKLLHDAFETGIKELKGIQDSHQKRCERLEMICKEEEKRHWNKVNELKEKFKESINSFQAMDSRLDSVAAKVIYLGDQLEGVNTPRSRAVEVYKLLKQLGEFLSPTSETNTTPTMTLTNRDSLYEDADVIHKLYQISQELPANGVFDRAQSRIAEKYDLIERELIEEFVRAYRLDEKTKMKEIASIMQNFKGYNQCIDAFIEQSQMGIIVGTGPLDNRDIFADIVVLCEKIQHVVQEVFKNPDQIMLKFLLNIYHGKLKEHIRYYIDSSGDPEKYLCDLHSLFLRTVKLSNQLSSTKILGADPSFLNKLTRNIFSQYLDTYIKTEITAIKERCVAILNRYYESKNHQKKPASVSSIQDLKARFSRAKNLNISGIANINVNIGQFANINIAFAGDPLPPGETLLSEEVAISLLHEIKQALVRCQLLSKTGEVAENAVELFDIQLQYLCIEHIEYAIDIGLTFLPSSEPKSQPDLYFFDIVRQCNAICHLIEKQFVDCLVPLIQSTPKYPECVKRKRDIMEQLEMKLNSGIERSLTAYIGWIRSVLQSEQKKTDFKPENEDSVTLASTPACAKVCKFVRAVTDKIKDCLDGENVVAVSTEFGVRFHKTISDHLQQYQFSSIGAMVAIGDVREYSSAISDKKDDSTSKKFRNETVENMFDMLHALCNLLVVPPENLRQVCSEDRLVGVDQNILNNFVQLRADYKVAKLHQIKGSPSRTCFVYSIILFSLLEIFTLTVNASQIELRLPSKFSAITSDDVWYRVDYEPSRGTPLSGFRLTPLDIRTNANVIIADTLPGAEYRIDIYQSNGTTFPTLFWSTNYTTEPDPPRDLSVDVITGKQVKLDWLPPIEGAVSGYQAKIIPLLESDETSSRTLNVGANEYTLQLHDLTPGATYEVQLQSMFAKKPSNAFLSANFTTKPNTPGRFIVWFRNETTLLVLWQPPFPSGTFDKYRVTITPPDSTQSELEIDRDESLGPAQAAFHGLLPGRNYSISVQTVSHDQYSQPTESQYRTVPLPPSNITYDRASITQGSFEIRWSPPRSHTEFDRYQVSLGTKSSAPKIIYKDEERIAKFDEGLEPGHTYEVVVKAVSGSVASWPITANVTTAPLPVQDLKATHGKAGELLLEWTPNNASQQDSYMVRYHEVEAFNSEGSVQVVHDKTQARLVNLLAGGNFSIAVLAVSKDIHSEPTVVYGVTRPAPPIVESKPVALAISDRALNVTWKWDVTSRQDSYKIGYIRNDTRQRKESVTRENYYVLDNLFPGATYHINVSAISYGLISEPYSYFQTVFPRSPENLQIVKVTNSTISLTWVPPQNSLVDHYCVKFKTIDSSYWREHNNIDSTSVVLKDLEAGERYILKVISISNKVESVNAKEIEQTMYPNSITEIKSVLDAYNLTFQWSMPTGQVDYYLIFYNAVRELSPQQTKKLDANHTRTGQLMSAIIDGLKPGELYSFMFYSVSHNLRSEGIALQLRTMPVINSVIHVVIDEHATKTLGIKYTPTPSKLVVFDKYKFQISDPNAAILEKAHNDSNRLVLFDSLMPGRLYNISIWTVSGGLSSNPITRQARLYPEPVRSISAVSITDTEIILMWETPLGDNDAFEVQYLEPREKHLRSNITFAEKIAFTNLRPHSNYTFIVTVLSGYGTSTMLRSSPISQTFSTLESIPGKVKSFHASEVKPNEITLRWALPQTDQNGILTGYKISYQLKGNPVIKHKYFEPYQTNGTIHDLAPGRVYIFQIQAHTKVGAGHKAIWEETMPIWAPPPPEDSMVSTEVSHTSTTIKTRFRKNYFSNQFGPIIAYTIIVAEDTTKPSNQLELPSWFEVQSQSIWPPYQAVEPYYPFNNSLIEDFIVGADDCFNAKLTEKYCNGPLKPGTSYRIKVRAFTGPEKFTDTAFSQLIVTDPDNTFIYVGILMPMALLLVLAITIAVLKRRHLGPFSNKTVRKNGLSSHLSTNGTLNFGHGMKDDNISIGVREFFLNRPIKLKDFAEHFRIMSADSDFRFSEEFELLKYVGTDKTYKIADLPVNRPKNRFTNIVPYDHSRVKLSPTDDEEGSDYINANYIPGYNSPREFIVTQGPLFGTRDDFWRMLWEQDSRAIVMLTRCTEKGRDKCDRYWPCDTQPVTYGNIHVTMLNECQYCDWTITEMKVCRDKQSRIVRHFHFTTWPDFGVPDPPSTLVQFVRAFREKVPPSNSHPIIAHCSAGVGRSGTFIALDRILQHIRTHDYVDIFGIVCEMRRERVYMVQNEQQYICIHQCLLWILEGKEDQGTSKPVRQQEMQTNQSYEDDDEGIAESGI
ncbi:Tyrosine-protein phosphatase 10D, partial [Fragariocoptes setiger]